MAPKTINKLAAVVVASLGFLSFASPTLAYKANNDTCPAPFQDIHKLRQQQKICDVIRYEFIGSGAGVRCKNLQLCVSLQKTEKPDLYKVSEPPKSPEVSAVKSPPNETLYAVSPGEDPNLRFFEVFGMTFGIIEGSGENDGIYLFIPGTGAVNIEEYFNRKAPQHDEQHDEL